MNEAFRKLLVWQKAHDLTLMIYRITKEFPSDERFGLVSQLRRSMMSVPSNIVEGYKRDSVKEKMRFYNIAEASLEEAKYQMILAHDLNYADMTQALLLADEVGKMLYSFKNSIKRHTS